MDTIRAARNQRRAFADAELWAILTAPDDVTSATLARQLGCNEHSVRVARARLRREGWTCRVAYRPCRHCGALLTARGSRAGQAAYHPACRRRALADMDRRHERVRWDRMSDEERLARIDRAHRHTEAKQAETQPGAINRGSRWDPSDDARLMAEDAPPDYVLAKELGRSLHAVRGRKQRLRGTT